MKPKYTTQVLIKQVKLDLYSAQYIVDLLIQEEISKWKTIFNKVLYDLIKYPQIKCIYTERELYHMYYYYCFNLLEAIQLGNTIQQKKQNFKKNPKFTIDFTYYQFYEKSTYNINKETILKNWKL
jgi:hypothetical protein